MEAPLTLLEVRTLEGEKVASRSRLYHLLASGLNFPSPETFSRLRGGEFGKELRMAASGLPFPLEIETGWELGGSYEEFQGKYISIFEVGGEEGPPCPLYEGSYGGGKTKIMEELLGFYHFFGVRLSPGKERELPDHITSELEFMHFLTFREATALEGGKDRGPYLAGERDFLQLHLADFASTLASKLTKSRGFFPGLSRLTEALCQKDLAYLAGLVSTTT